MQLQEIAESCGISLATVKRRLSRAERKFELLAEHDAVLREHLNERGAP
jgi:DNA-directed RNA polymerase specialized sigma24 family protein